MIRSLQSSHKTTKFKVYQTLEDSECLLVYQYVAVDDARVYKYKRRRQGDAPKVAMTTGDEPRAPHRDKRTPN